MDHREAPSAPFQDGGGEPHVGPYPPNEPSIWRIDVLSKDVLVHTGTTIAIRPRRRWG